MSKEQKHTQEEENRLLRKISTLSGAIGFFAILLILNIFIIQGLPDKPEVAEQAVEEDYDKVENGIHVATGFVAEGDYQLIIQNCTNCHSSKLVIQNRFSKENWKKTIKWMQETQNLWDLGENEEPILNYLAKYYAPNKKGRRQNLQITEWYELKD